MGAGRLLRLLVLAVVAFSVASCGGDGDDSATDQATGTAGSELTGEPVKIGVLTGLTGDYGPWGEAGLDATQLAVDEVNAAGGVLGRPLELVVVDNKSTAEGAVAGWSKLIDVDKVAAVVGIESPGTIALFDAANEAQVPLICAACGTTFLDDKGGEYVFRLTGGDTELGVALAQVALEQTSEASLLVQQGSEATEDPAGVFAAAFEKGGGQVVDDIRFSPEATTFQADLEQAFANSENVMLATGLEAGTSLLSEWLRRGYGGKLFMIPELISSEVAGLGNGALDGVAFGIGFAYDEEIPAYQSFAERFEERFDVAPSPAMYEPNYYDQIMLLALAAVAAEDASSQGMAESLKEVANEPGTVVYSYEEGVAELDKGNDIAYHGASGPLEFDDLGNVTSVYAETAVENGEWVTVRNIEIDPNLKAAG